MTVTLFEAFLPVIGLLINVLIQVVIYRAVPRIGLLRSIFIGFGSGLVSIIAIEIVVNVKDKVLDIVGILATVVITYSALGYCYFHFLNLGETARRIRIIRELSDSQEGLSIEDILKRYNAQDIVQKRIQRLLKSEQIVEDGDRYYIKKPVLLIMARIIQAMKVIFLGRKSEFDSQRKA